MLAALVSKANEKAREVNQLKLPQAECFIAGRLGEENYMQIMDMVDEYKKIKEVSNDERFETAKKTIMVFPGITQVFISEESACKYLEEPMPTSEKLFKVLFKVAVDVQGDIQPFDIRKFLGTDASEQATKMGEGAIQRLKVQVQSYCIRDKEGKEVLPETVTKKLIENGKKPSLIDDVYDWTHIFYMRRLENTNNPNTATNLMDYQKQSF